jgi:hypothetical protein
LLKALHVFKHPFMLKACLLDYTPGILSVLLTFLLSLTLLLLDTLGDLGQLPLLLLHKKAKVHHLSIRRLYFA